MFCSHQSSFFSVQWLKKNKYNLDYKISGDYELIARLVSSNDKSKIKHINKPFCIFDRSGVSSINRPKALKEDIRLRREILNLPYWYIGYLFVKHYVRFKLLNR